MWLWPIRKKLTSSFTVMTGLTLSVALGKIITPKFHPIHWHYFMMIQNHCTSSYSTAWNRLEIVNLDTMQWLTATKSLIESDELAKPDNSSWFWPSTFDYFYGQIYLSPSNRHFVSAGWLWGSFDGIALFDTQEFISSSLITTDIFFTGGHENRAVCWIDDSSLAVIINPDTEAIWNDDEEGNGTGLEELRIYHVPSGKFQKSVPLPLIGILHAGLSYSQSLNAFIAHPKELGLVIFSLQGEILLYQPSLQVYAVDSNAGRLLIKSEQGAQIINITLE